MRRLRKLSVVLLAALLTLALSISVAFAVSPHFVSATASVDSSGNLVVSWKEAGLGDNQLINYTASADATANYVCINGGGKHPSASNKETVSGPVSQSGSFNSGKNGNITASLTASPPGPGSFSCPNGQTLAVASVTYSNVTLADTTNNITVNLGTISTGCLLPNVRGAC
jgi:hypothetical protein